MTNKDKTKEECGEFCKDISNTELGQDLKKMLDDLPSDFTTKKIEELRKEWEKTTKYNELIPDVKELVDIASNWWLEKLSQSILQAQEAQKEQTRKEIVEKIEGLHKNHLNCPQKLTCIGYENAKEDIIELLKTTPPLEEK